MLEIIIFLLSFGADFVVKFWSMEVLANIPSKTINVIPNVFWLLYAENDGEDVSYIRSNEPPMIIFRILQAVLFIFIMIKYRKKLAAITRFALAMFLAGMAGNQFNYLTLGFVPDMFVIARIPSVFNVADILIIVSSTILFIRFAFFEGQEFVDWLVRKPEAPKKIRRKKRRDKIADTHSDVGWERESVVAGYNSGYQDDVDDQGYLLPTRSISPRESNRLASGRNRVQSSGVAYDLHSGNSIESGERKTAQRSGTSYEVYSGVSIASSERNTAHTSRTSRDIYSGVSVSSGSEEGKRARGSRTAQDLLSNDSVASSEKKRLQGTRSSYYNGNSGYDVNSANSSYSAMSGIDAENQAQKRKFDNEPYSAGIEADATRVGSYDSVKSKALRNSDMSTNDLYTKPARSQIKDAEQIKPFERPKPAEKEKKKSNVPPENWPSHFPPPRGDY